MLYAHASAPSGDLLSQEAILTTITQGLEGRFRNQRVLALIPDHTRTLPLPMLFRAVVETLHDVKQLDFMVALGTHLALDDTALNELVGISADERRTQFKHIGLLNHAWDDPTALTTLGTITQEQVKGYAGDVWHPSLGGDVPVQINRATVEYDHILIIGPTFPHEVVGFSGGTKYLYPGIAGPDIINVTHWMGALMTVLDTIGIEDTPMRRMIHAAADLIPTPITLLALVVDKSEIAGIFIGPHKEAHHASVALSSQRHIIWLDRPLKKVLSKAPPMYDELWTGAKAMYKLDPGIADGGEIIVYAPHLNMVSEVHGRYLNRIGYHVRDYFLKQWDRFSDIPLGVLAHSTHLKGSGTFENGVESPRIHVSLASKLSAEETRAINLHYVDPASINVDEWVNREDEDVLYVPKAGEYLYRVKS